MSMTHFIHLQKMSFRTDKRFKQLIIEYANFLQQPLERWMFVPCDEDGDVLEELLHIELYEGSTYDLDVKKYNDAKQKCLFDGFWIENYMLTNENIAIGKALTLYSDIQSLIADFTSNDIKLTPTALIQFT